MTTDSAATTPSQPSLHLPESSVALVTGGASGIGRAICEQLACLGAAVGVLDLDIDQAEQTASGIIENHGQALAVRCDVSDRPGVDAAVTRIADALGTPTLIVHNAGYTGPNVPFLDFPEEDEGRVIDVNYRGALNLVRSTAPRIIAEEAGGAFVFISSDAARIGTPKEAVYSGAKAAMIAYMKAMAIELAPHHIRLNVVSPGSTDTPLIRSILSAEQIERRVRANPMKRMGTPDDVAGGVVFLLTNAASYINGQVLSINGGMTRVD